MSRCMGLPSNTEHGMVFQSVIMGRDGTVLLYFVGLVDDQCRPLPVN